MIQWPWQSILIFFCWEKRIIWGYDDNGSFRLASGSDKGALRSKDRCDGWVLQGWPDIGGQLLQTEPYACFGVPFVVYAGQPSTVIRHIRNAQYNFANRSLSKTLSKDSGRDEGTIIHSPPNTNSRHTNAMPDIYNSSFHIVHFTHLSTTS
jgi:hypothetical protein